MKKMLSSMLSSTIFMVGTGSALGISILIMYLFMHEILPSKRTREEIKTIFMPVIASLTIIFAFTLTIKVIQILG